ncbi:MAG: hypothetical protein ACXWWA_08065 [Chitinophagaceae bacterium]
MRMQIIYAILLLAVMSAINFSCEKDDDKSLYDLNVALHNKGAQHGFIKFRQDPDPAKIITLDIWVQHLEPNREYLLQRAVDAVNEVDGNCTSASWLTLGKGLTLPAQTILTDNKGKGEQNLWRDVSAIPSGSLFDIHFRVIDAVSSAVVLTSDCHQYQVR